MTVQDKQQRSHTDRCVYVVSNWPGGGNDRVKKLLRLRGHFDKLVLVSPGDSFAEDDTRMVVPRFTNPLGILRELGFHNLKLKIERYLYFPSMDVLFAWRVRHRLANRIADDLARGKQVTLITAVPPHALGLIGLYVKKRCPGVRWVMDWQDLWSYDENYFLITPPSYRPRLRRLEREMLDTADLNLTTNAVASDILAQQYQVPRERLLHIHHHFDRGDFLAGEPQSRQQSAADGNLVRIGFLGSLFKPPRVPGMEVVDAVQKMRDSGLCVELHVHGTVGGELSDQLKNSQAIHPHGRISHEESVSKLLAYDYLLLLLSDLPNCKAVMSIKLPHYMVVDRPILAIVPKESAIAEIIRQTGTGVVIPVEEDWRSNLHDILQNSSASAGVATRNDDAIEAFAWSNISHRWMAAITGKQGTTVRL